jgi:hypothetical protein
MTPPWLLREHKFRLKELSCDEVAAIVCSLKNDWADAQDMMKDLLVDRKSELLKAIKTSTNPRSQNAVKILRRWSQKAKGRIGKGE